MTSPTEAVVEMRSTASDYQKVEKALVNAGVPVMVESREPFRFRIQSNVGVLSLLATILEGNKVEAQGTITLPNGRKFALTPEGLQELKGMIAEYFEKGQQPQATPTPPGGEMWILEMFREALRDPEATSKLVRELTNAFRGHPDVLQRQTRQVTNVTMTLLGLMGIVIGLTALLSALGRLSGDATGFIFGAVLGSAFTFLQRYLTEPSEE